MNLMLKDSNSTRSRVSRRRVLRGIVGGGGAAVGLPMLDAMSGGGCAGAAGSVQTPVRMACLFVPNGVIGDRWFPKRGDSNDAAGWELSPAMTPLRQLKSKLNVIADLELDNGRAGRDGAGDHARGGSTFLTAARPVKTSSHIRLGVSVDQVAATQIGDQTRLPSIELGLVGSRNAGSCDSGYSCAYSSNISWRSESQPMPKEIIPRLAFERMFGDGDQADARRRRLRRQSILDVISDDADRLMKQLGGSDLRKMDEYFTGLREIERRIERTEREDAAALPDLQVPDGRVDAFEEHSRLMLDLMVVAFQTDTTRVASLMFDMAGGNRVYKKIGVTGAHHGMSHHRGDANKVEQLAKVDRYLIEQLAYFLGRLDSIPEGDGTLLDNSMVLYGSGLGDGNRHTHDHLPIILAGGGGGQIRTGRYLTGGDDSQLRPMANLFMSMLDVMGTPAESIGDSTGRLDGLVG